MTHEFPRRTAMLVALAALAALAHPARAAAQSWPSRPITIIAACPPGDVADQMARVLAIELSKRVGQAVTVEKPRCRVRDGRRKLRRQVGARWAHAAGGRNGRNRLHVQHARAHGLSAGQGPRASGDGRALSLHAGGEPGRGRRSEIDHLTGYVAGREQMVGVPTPVNRCLQLAIPMLESRA